MDLLHVLVQEVVIHDKALKFCDTVQEATSDLTSHFSMNVVNGEVDGIADKLKTFLAILHGIQLLNVNLGEANLLDLRYWLRRSGLSRYASWLRLATDLA